MITIEKKYSGKPLRIYIEDGTVLVSARDLCWLIGDRNANRRLARAGIDDSRYRFCDTRGGVQRMRLVTPKECAVIFTTPRPSGHMLAVASWLGDVFRDLATMKRDFCGGC